MNDTMIFIVHLQLETLWNACSAFQSVVSYAYVDKWWLQAFINLFIFFLAMLKKHTIIILQLTHANKTFLFL